MLDFDHNTTIQKELQVCNTLNIVPVFGYTSFSHSEEEHRFRLAFVTDENRQMEEAEKKNQGQAVAIGKYLNDLKEQNSARN